jgi:serine/threonine protein kinase/WD40 repeat protein
MTEMSPAEAIFFAAAALPSTERAAYLAKACAGHDDLRRRVEQMLTARPVVGDFLEPVPADSLTQASERQASTKHHNNPTACVGSILAGKYKLIEEIGEGGMGSVYMAQQTQPVKRAVAVKVIKAGMDSRAVLARFEAERQALAMMDHPNIARVLDAGTTDEGRPFFVMELVKGMPITKHCDERKLTPRQRLELFIPVCQAIQHAHQKGIIHRDIKPSNVLVAMFDDRAVPKVIDFGVAKATGQSLTEKTLMTGFGAVVGTAEYMSPEQANLNNMDIDTRSDIYSLGVLLYELLTGSTPVDRKSLGKAALLEILRIVREVEAPRPSAKLSTIDTLPSVAADRGTEPAKLSKLLKGELDWIVLKALEKDRARRYETTNGLVRDIQRYLADEVVEARPPSVAYRMRKVMRRYRAPLAAAGAFCLLLIMAAVVSSLLAVRATKAEREASQRADEVQEANVSLREARDELAANLYGARSNLIQNAWEGNAIPRALALLDEQLPRPGQRDFRGFEWHYWRLKLHGALRTLALPREPEGGGEVAFSADCKRLVAWIADSKDRGWIAVWDTATGKELLFFDSKTLTAESRGPLSYMALSRDGTRLALAHTKFEPLGTEGRLFLWDAISGKVVHTWKGWTNHCSDPAISSDNKWIALSLQNGPNPEKGAMLRVWDTSTGKEVLTIPDIPGRPRTPTFHPDGKRIAAVITRGEGAERPSIIKVWDTRTGRELLSIKANAGSFPHLVFSPDGSRLASSGARRTGSLQVWDTSSGKLLLDVARAEEPYAVAGFSPDGSRLACVGPSSVISILNAATGRVQLTLKGNPTSVERLKFTPDGNQLYSVDHNKTMTVWDVTGSDQPASLKGLTATNPGIAINVDKQLIAAIGLRPNGKGDELRVWAFDGTPVRAIDRPIPFAPQWVYARQLALSADGRRLVYITGNRGTDGQKQHHDTVLAMIDVATGKEVFALHEQREYEAVALRPDGQFLAVFVAGGLIGEDANRLKASERPPNEVRVIEVATGKEVFRRPVHSYTWLPHLSFSPRGGYLACARAEEQGTATVKVWEVRTGREVLSLPDPPPLTQPAMAFSPDETRIALTTGSQSQPGEIKVYALSDGKEILTLRGHTSVVSGVTFSRDGKRLASTEEGFGQPGVVKVWDAETGKDLLTLRGHTAQVWTAAFSPDGTRLYSAGSSDTGYGGCELKVWDATPIEAPR